MSVSRRRKVETGRPTGMRASTKTMIVGVLTVSAGILGAYWKTHSGHEPAMPVPAPATTIAPVFNNNINIGEGAKAKAARPEYEPAPPIDPVRPPPPPVEAMEAKSSHPHSRLRRPPAHAYMNIGSGAQTSIGY